MNQVFKVPGTGIEPAHPCERQILSLLRLPIPPPGQRGAMLQFFKDVNKKFEYHFYIRIL